MGGKVMEKLAIKGGYPVRGGKIYYGRQWIDEEDIKAVAEVLRSDFITCGPKVDEMERTLEKYQIGFIYDVDAYLKTLEMVKGLKGAVFVPAHADASEDIAALAQLNIQKIHEIAEKIETICKEPVIFEKVLQKLFQDYGLAMNFEQYVLVGSTIRSYLSWLKDTGKVDAVFRDSMLLWQRI